MYGHLLVPHKFEFSEEEVDIGPMGTALGKHVKNLRRTYQQSRTKTEPWIAVLNSLGFEWDAREARFRLLMHAVLTYKEVYGDFLVPAKFVVPKYSRDFPPAFWGLRVGQMYHDLRKSTRVKEHAARMQQLGIPTVGVLPRRAEMLLQAIEVYKRLNGQTAETLNIARGFCVNICDEDWPEELWGFPLRQAVDRVIHRGAFEEFHPQFIAAGLKVLPKEAIERRREKKRNYDQRVREMGQGCSPTGDLAES